MNIALIQDWKLVLKKAWSVRFNVLSAALGALEIAFPLIPPSVIPAGTIPQFAFLGASIAVSLLSNAVRVMAQKEITNADQTPAGPN